MTGLDFDSKVGRVLALVRVMAVVLKRGFNLEGATV
jgi:hypothetical protein